MSNDNMIRAKWRQMNRHHFEGTITRNQPEPHKMADVRDLFYHGIRQQIRRVLEQMGEKRIEAGLTAFENGASSWSACFFARAYPELDLTHGNAELQIARALGMGTNKVPMRIVYTLFDGLGKGKTMDKTELMKFIRAFIDSPRDPEMAHAIDRLLESIDFTSAHGDGQIFDEAKCATS